MAARGGGPYQLDTTAVVAWWTSRAQGDLRLLGTGGAPPAGMPEGLVVRRLRQEHGDRVVFADDLWPTEESGPGDAGLGDSGLEGADDAGPGGPPPGDALVARRQGQALAVLTADCAALALGSPQGIYGAVHAGWRGLLAGVIENAVAAVRHLGADPVVAGIGPCIGPCCYAFAGPPLDHLRARYGGAVRARTADGNSALDLATAAGAALEGAGVRLVLNGSWCTGCQADSWSYRARADHARQALLVWRSPG